MFPRDQVGAFDGDRSQMNVNTAVSAAGEFLNLGVPDERRTDISAVHGGFQPVCEGANS